MNRWHVFEWMKRRYMATGLVPRRDEVLAAFPELNWEEIREGMAEFQAVMKWGA